MGDAYKADRQRRLEEIQHAKEDAREGCVTVEYVALKELILAVEDLTEAVGSLAAAHRLETGRAGGEAP